MLNQVVLVGRLTKDVEVKELEGGKKFATITLAIPRPFKNDNGEYETDFVDATIWDNVSTNTAEYCHKGDIVGIKGRIQSKLCVEEDGTKVSRIEIYGEKVTFLSTNKKDGE